MQKILIQGESGSFHHQAAEQLFGPQIEIIPCASFSQLFAGLDDTTIGLSAIENSLYGSINEVYDLLEKSGAQIFAETELVIHQNLIGLPECETLPEHLSRATLSDGESVSGKPRDDAREEDVPEMPVNAKIKEIYSHAVALEQCKNYLEKNFPSAEKIEFEDTAAAVRHIVETGDPTKAAIAGAQTLKLYDVKMLAEKIEDNPVNFTRFVAVKKKDSSESEALQNNKLASNLPVVGKSSLILTTGHQPGALYEALGIFVAHQLNLTKLQSRPIIGEKWRYKFYIDFLGDATAAQNVVKDLEEAGNEVHCLGSY